MKLIKLITAGALLLSSSQLLAVTIAPVEDVMASGFFFSPNDVRGYAGDSRPVFRASTENAFGLGKETIYLTFDSADFSSFSSVNSAVLSMESVDGGFGANAGAGNAFTVSAHALSADPLSSITDDTNPSGTISSTDYYYNNILAAEFSALTAIDSFGTVTFDVTSIVSDWVAGSNAVFAIALTGLYDISGNDFLHGFLNNTETPGSTFLSVDGVSAVPIPAAVWLFGSAIAGLFATSRKQKSLQA